MSARLALSSTERSSDPARKPSLLTRRAAGLPPWVVVTQLFFGFAWLRVAAEKIVEPSWWNGSEVTFYVAVHEPDALGWYWPFLEHVVRPNAGLIAWMLVFSQLAVGASLLSGRLTGWAITLGMFMNVNFLVSGAVNPSVFYILGQGAIALWMVERASVHRRLPAILSGISLTALVLGILSLPYVRRVDPVGVIEDPGIMFAFVCFLTIVGCELTHRSVYRGASMPIFRKSERRGRTSLFADEETRSLGSGFVDDSGNTSDD